MIRRILAAVLVVLGLVAIGLGVASATVWRSSDTVTADMPNPTAPVVVVEPGVLGMVAESVTLTARAADADAPVVLAFAPTGDVDAWLGDAAHHRVTGMSSWTDLRIEDVAGEETVPNPAGADLWRSEITGTGELVEELTADSADVALLAATDGTAPAPAITLEWSVPVDNPYFVPLMVAGGILLLAGLGLIAYDVLVRREVRARDRAREARREADSTATAQMRALPAQDAATVAPAVAAAAGGATAPALTDTALTRRQLRELERRRRQEDPRQAADGPVARSGGMAGAGIVPAVLDPERHRALRYVEEPPEEEQPVVPAAEEETGADAGPARGSAIVPGVADPDRHRTAEPERTSWRALWGFGEEEQR